MHALLLLMTADTTTIAGAKQYSGFISGFTDNFPAVSVTTLLIHGLWYSGTILAILG